MELSLMRNTPALFSYQFSSTLSTVQSLSDYCKMTNQIQKNQNPTWLNQFNFIAYSLSLRQLPFKQMIDNIKLFMLNNDLYWPAPPSTIYFRIGTQFFQGLFDIISKEDFTNRKSKDDRLIVVLTLIHQFKKKLNEDQSASEVKAMLNRLQAALLEKRDGLFDKKYIQMSNQYLIGLLPFNAMNQCKKGASGQSGTKSKKQKSIISSNDNAQIKAQIDPLPMANDFQTVQVDSLPKKEESISTSNDSRETKNIMPTCKHNNSKCLLFLINESLYLQKAQANFYAPNYYEDSQFSLLSIGSNTFGLNTPSSKMDFLLIPKLFTKEITLNGIVNWLKYKPMNDKNFTYHPFPPDRKDNTKLHFSYELNGKSIDCILFILNEKYIKSSALIKKIYCPGSIAAYLHIFFRPVLISETGIDLIFLILSFLHFKLSLFRQKQKQLNYRKGEITENGIYIEKKDHCYYFENGFTKRDQQKCMKQIDMITLRFLKYYHSLYGSVSNGNGFKKLKEVSDPYYMFSIYRSIERMKTENADKGYWDKVKHSRQMIQDGYFNTYNELVKYFNEKEKN